MECRHLSPWRIDKFLLLDAHPTGRISDFMHVIIEKVTTLFIISYNLVMFCYPKQSLLEKAGAVENCPKNHNVVLSFNRVRQNSDFGDTLYKGMVVM